MKMQMHLIIFVPQVLRDNPAQDFKYHREINVCQGLQSDNFNTLRVCNYGYNIFFLLNLKKIALNYSTD
jgi:hypothetical protein